MKRVFLLLLLACCLLIAPAAAAGGSGTAADPYIIQTAAELQSIQNNLAAYYKLANDINLSGVTWTPIGSSAAPFTGSFDGNSHTISNLIISQSSTRGGIFNFCYNAHITNLYLYNCHVSSGSESGVLIGGMNNCNLENIQTSSCSITTQGNSIGIISGINYGGDTTITDCIVEDCVATTSNGFVGCIIGDCTDGHVVIDSSTVYNSRVFGDRGGLLCGSSNANGKLTIIDSHVRNSIAESNTYNGLMVGHFSSSQPHSISGGSVINSVCKSGSYSGSISSYIPNGVISNVLCSRNTIVSVTNDCGGIIGHIGSGTISDCTVSDTTILSPTIAAGIAVTATISDCTVTDTNIYGSTIYDIGPSGSYDSTSTASGITNVPNRYLYASGLSYSTSGNTATFTIDDRQGAAVIETSTGAAAAINYDYGDGNTGTTNTHTYAAGIYTAGVTLSNYLQTTPQTFYTTPINIGIPTYTANTITQQDADIVIDAGQLYQAQTQFVLPSTTSDLEFFADNVFVVASGNAVYLIDTATEQIEPVSNTTGTTAEKIYLGEHAAIITDIDGNTAVYQYAENSFDYLASGDNQQIATTQNYAGIIINGELNIYDLSEPRKIGDITASVSQLAGNDYADTFAGYSGSTFYYWWIDNGEIKSGSQTITDTITGLKQIPQTRNYIITTVKNTLIVSVSATGVYELVSTSDTEEPLIHPQATTSNIIIGVHPPNEVYIVGADGSTTGTYQTGATLNDASISKATGLYAITGGNDQQAYLLRKDQSSTWTLAQTIKANGALSHTQISTTGVYASLVSGVNLYLLKISTNTDTNYYLNGIVIDTNGLPYNGDITINGEKVQTDKSGKFTYPITPGVKYIINAKGSITEYTATNAALQQIAIRIKAGLLSTDVTYSADYSAESQAIIMAYDDAAGKTTAVNWKVYETANNTLVATYTGNTASYPIEAGDVYNNYYVQLSADRGGATVTNTWSITPAGGQPIDLYGLDEDGRNIIFGFLLLLLAGLFGVMHSRSGAIIVALGACVMRYLELITIPWILITIAAVLAIVAAIAHGGQNR